MVADFSTASTPSNALNYAEAIGVKSKSLAPYGAWAEKRNATMQNMLYSGSTRINVPIKAKGVEFIRLCNNYELIASSASRRSYPLGFVLHVFGFR